MPSQDRRLVDREPKYVTVALQVAGESRKATFLGREFRVIPAVMVRSQVLNNNLGASFLSAADITEEWAELWNGIPVLVGPHPEDQGVPCTGRNADLWNERLGGWIFNARAVRESNLVSHLSGEVWLDESRVDAVPGLQAILTRVDAKQPVELSTGFPVQVENSAGIFQGAMYQVVMHPAGADHLVISTEMTGSCSVQDGCGLGVNKYQGKPPMEQQQEKGWQAALKRAGELFSRPKPEPVTWEENEARQMAREMEIRNSLPTSDRDRESRIRDDLQEKYGSKGEVCVADVFSETKAVVFWLHTPLGCMPEGPEYFRCTFTESADGGEFTFDTPERVERKTVYEAVADTDDDDPVAGNTKTAANCKPCVSREGATMSKEKEGEGQGASGGVTLDQIKDLISPIASAVQTLTGKVTEMEAAAKADPNPSIAGLKQTIAGLVQQFDKMKGITESAVAERDRERQSLVEKLAGNYKVPFNEAELEAKPLEELRKLADMAGIESYAARGGPRSASANTDSEARFVEPVPYFKDEDRKGVRDRKEGK